MSTSADWIGIRLSGAEVKDARRAAAARDARGKRAGARARGDRLGTDQAHFIGVLCEDAVAKYEAVPKVHDDWADDRARGFDVAGWGVRGRTKSHYGLYLYANETRGNWLAALGHEAPRRIWLAGWLSAEEFWQLGPVRRQHKGEAFWTLDQSHLRPLPEQNGYVRRGQDAWLIDPQTPFWCEACERMHSIAEHRLCRTA